MNNISDALKYVFIACHLSGAVFGQGLIYNEQVIRGLNKTIDLEDPAAVFNLRVSLNTKLLIKSSYLSVYQLYNKY
jgi:hypothetical protein